MIQFQLEQFFLKQHQVLYYYRFDSISNTFNFLKMDAQAKTELRKLFSYIMNKKGKKINYK